MYISKSNPLPSVSKSNSNVYDINNSGSGLSPDGWIIPKKMNSESQRPKLIHLYCFETSLFWTAAVWEGAVIFTMVMQTLGERSKLESAAVSLSPLSSNRCRCRCQSLKIQRRCVGEIRAKWLGATRHAATVEFASLAHSLARSLPGKSKACWVEDSSDVFFWGGRKKESLVQVVFTYWPCSCGK